MHARNRKWNSKLIWFCTTLVHITSIIKLVPGLSQHCCWSSRQSSQALFSPGNWTNCAPKFHLEQISLTVPAKEFIKIDASNWHLRWQRNHRWPRWCMVEHVEAKDTSAYQAQPSGIHAFQWHSHLQHCSQEFTLLEHPSCLLRVSTRLKVETFISFLQKIVTT